MSDDGIELDSDDRLPRRELSEYSIATRFCDPLRCPVPTLTLTAVKGLGHNPPHSLCAQLHASLKQDIEADHDTRHWRTSGLLDLHPKDPFTNNVMAF